MDLNEAIDYGVLGRQWHQLHSVQTTCTSLQTDNHTSTSSLNFTGRMLFLTLNQQCQSTEALSELLIRKLSGNQKRASYRPGGGKTTCAVHCGHFRWPQGHADLCVQLPPWRFLLGFYSSRVAR